MPHGPNTWTDALFIYPLYHVNFLSSFMEWFRFFFFNGVTVKTENRFNILWGKVEFIMVTSSDMVQTTHSVIH